MKLRNASDYKRIMLQNAVLNKYVFGDLVYKLDLLDELAKVNAIMPVAKAIKSLEKRGVKVIKEW